MPASERFSGLKPLLRARPTGPSALPSLADLAARVHTINPDTGLSTDFLNQYNELSMMLDLAADAPDMLEELEDWSPRTYQEHFAASGFKDWQLVVQAYGLCPPAIRAEFDAAIDVLNSVAACGVAALLNMEARTEPAERRAAAARALVAELQAAIVHASGLINGSNTLGSQAQVDTLFARAQAELAPAQTDSTMPGPSAQDRALPAESAETAAPAPVAADGDLLDQHAIDALFD